MKAKPTHVTMERKSWLERAGRALFARYERRVWQRVAWAWWIVSPEALAMHREKRVKEMNERIKAGEKEIRRRLIREFAHKPSEELGF